MAGGGNFIHRVVSYVANELIVNGLANSKGVVESDDRILIANIVKSRKSKQNTLLSERIGMITLQFGAEGLEKCGGVNFITLAGDLNFHGEHLIYYQEIDRGKSPAFQRFAVRTSKRIEELSTKATEMKKEVAEQVKDLSKNMGASKNQ